MIHVCEHHDEVLRRWRERDRRGIRLAHVDFHDDLRGLMIDRRRGVAYPLGGWDRGGSEIDAGNFLAWAVVERRLRSVRWVHDPIGGRAWDMGIVRYAGDLSAAPRRWLAGCGAEIELEFDELLLHEWDGLRAEEDLSVDWDCFASILQPAASIDDRVERFFERLGDHPAAESWLAYSPEYCHPSLGTFRGFVERLAARFEQPVEWLTPELERGRLQPREVVATLPRSWAKRAILALRRKGVY